MASSRLDARRDQLAAARVPFVEARVVLAERPTSAQPGDEALILADGTVEGFVGGTCTESSVRTYAMALLESGESLVLRIAPSPGEGSGAGPGRALVHNPCLSGGVIEVFLQPRLPAPLVVVAGTGPIARAVLDLGTSLGYDVRPHEGAVPPGAAAVVVASHGREEEEILETALAAGVPYVGLVASPKRGRAVVDSLAVDDDRRAQVHTPAGLDIGARTPGEVAVSILAEIVAAHPRPAPPAAPADPPPGQEVDPVCGMTVMAGAGALHVDHGDRRVWFCGRGCRQAFVADPSAYG
ncbi:MAG TPA: XdhC family protein [Acidimicrobiales bacterium]|nr:XdhC family protein [Acidimicrobiales bacterium]